MSKFDELFHPRQQKKPKSKLDLLFSQEPVETDDSVLEEIFDDFPLEEICRKTPDDNGQIVDIRTGTSSTAIETKAPQKVALTNSALSDSNPFSILRKLLSKVTFRIVNGALYTYNGICYDHITKADEVYRLIMDNLREDVSSLGRVTILDDLYKLVRAEPDIVVEDHEGDDYLVFFRNGIYDVMEKKFMDLNPKIFSTSYVNVDLDPSKTECPNFDRYLEDVTGGDKHLTKALWQAIGYVISPDTKAKKFFVFKGPSNSGKTVLCQLLSSLFLPKYVTAIDIQKLGDRFSGGSLATSRLNVAADLPNTVLSANAVSAVKNLTGGDTIQAEQKFKDSFPIKVKCKLIFATNHDIYLTSPDHAFQKRLMIFPFNNAIPEHLQDHNILQMFEPEKPAICLKALKKCWKFVKNGYRFEEYDSTVYLAKVQPKIEEILPLFIEQCCVLKPDSFTSVARLFEAYSRFCDENGHGFAPQKEMFSETLNRLYGDNSSEKLISPTRKSGSRGYVGIELLD